MKVAYYSPLPPARSGIADYSALLLPALRAADRRRRRRGPAASAATPKADVALYHVGNDPDAHGWIVEALRRRPGVVVLHEFVLHHLVAGITLGRGDVDGYLAAMRARGRARRAACSRTACSTGCIAAALGDAAARLPARRRGARPRRPG